MLLPRKLPSSKPIRAAHKPGCSAVGLGSNLNYLPPLMQDNRKRVPVKRSRKSALPARWEVIRCILDWARGEFLPTAGSLNRYARFLDRIRRVLVTRGVPGGLA